MFISELHITVRTCTHTEIKNWRGMLYIQGEETDSQIQILWQINSIHDNFYILFILGSFFKNWYTNNTLNIENNRNKL